MMKKKVNPVLLRQVLRSAAAQITNKFVYAQASSEKAAKVREALNLLTMAGLLVPVPRTDANGQPARTAYQPSERCYRLPRLAGVPHQLRLHQAHLGTYPLPLLHRQPRRRAGSR